jgi:penicillin amidase
LLGFVRARSGSSRLPERGTVVERIAGCPASVDVVFDRWGIPHLRTDDDRALWFGQGYLHARDRFFQMEMARRRAAGRLAEILGPSALAEDRKLRTWRLSSVAQRQLVQLETAERRALDAYTAGVNAALAAHGRWISPEIWFLGVTPEPWRPEDSLRIGVLLHFSMSWAMGEELQRAVQLSTLGRDRAVDLWGWSPREARRWIPPGEWNTAALRADEPIVPPLEIMGSNAWALASHRSAEGRPLLANDPHLGVQMPGIWFAIHLTAPGINVAGLSVPGAPGVLVGHNERVAWGLTSAMVDDQDLYRITLDDEGKAELIDGNWQALRTVTEEIWVRWRPEPVVEKIRLSKHGPLVREDRNEALALSWSGYEGPNPLRAVLQMDRAQSAEEVADAWLEVHGPTITLVAADVDGHILRETVGSVPRRGRGAGRLPAPGADSAWAWQGLRPLADRMSWVDPASGYLAAANHDPYSEGDVSGSPQVPGEYDAPWRVRRIRHKLSARHDWNVAGCLELQGEVVSDLALVALKQLWPDLDEHGGATARLLSEWDGRMDADAVEPHLFTRLLAELGTQIGNDEALRAGLDRHPIGASELLRLMAGGLDESWWDDVGSPATEDRAAIMTRALTRLDELALSAKWGEVHQVKFEHPFVRIPVLGRFIGRGWSRGPLAVAGDSTTVNANYWRLDDPFAVFAIPSARFVADVGNWDATVLVLPPGQSGRPWSTHYADQLDAWLKVEALSFPFSDEAVAAAAAARLIIEPALERD